MSAIESLSPPSDPVTPRAPAVRPVVGHQQEITAERIEELRRYMDKHVFRDKEMTCPHFAACNGSIRKGDGVKEADRFYEGQLSHVGRHYDLTVDGKAMRIVMVGQEYGLWTPGGGQRVRKYVSLEDRYEMIHDGSGRCAFAKRNPHMQGTTSALRVLLGNGLGSDEAGEFVDSTDGDRFHVFDAMALVNVLLCSAGPVGSSTGRSTPVMRSNCLVHFTKTMEILRPTVLVLQGISVQRWLEPKIEGERKSDANANVSRAEVAGVSTVVCRLTHPSAHGELGWRGLKSRYLIDVVEPALRAAVSEDHGIKGATEELQTPRGTLAVPRSVAQAPTPRPSVGSRTPWRPAPPSVVSGAEVSQTVTAKDLEAGRIRFPRATKRLFPSQRAYVDVVVRGHKFAAVRWDPRNGPDRERSGLLGVGKGKLDGLVSVGDVLAVVPAGPSGRVDLR